MVSAVTVLTGPWRSQRSSGAPQSTSSRAVAPALAPLFHAMLGEETVLGVRFWDGTILGPPDPPATIVLRTPRALRRILYAPDELGFGRAFVTGDLDIEGDLLATMSAVDEMGVDLRLGPRRWLAALAAAARLGVLGAPPPRPPEEARVHGLVHSKARDAQAIAHHYDVGNDFYRLVLGPSMTYSCARFRQPDDTLEAAQESKHDLVCAKLGLEPGMRLLDVGCGWGAMARRAASRYGATVVGITLSAQQQAWAREANARAGLADRVDIRLQDYRDLQAESFDAISSIGMFEHVGRSRLQEYFGRLYSLLRPGGRLLNHAISTPEGSHYGRRSFLLRYVFPDGELQDVGTTILAMEQAGFEARDVECLREHYALTLRRWVANLERRWDEAVGLVGANRARVWRLYMSGSVSSFEKADIAVHQVLGVRLASRGHAGLPLTRSEWS